MKKHCYRCDKPATSREHVPPKCLFPEAKDIGTDVFRTQLITVPSCDVHNLQKSDHDEFLLMTLAGVVGNNAIGYFHNKTKVRKAISNKKLGITGGVMKDFKLTQWTDKNGNTHEVFEGSTDYGRLIECFESIAIGLFYHERKETFKGECSIILGYIKSNNENSEKTKLICEKIFESQSEIWPTKGANPEVFSYQFAPTDQLGLTSLKMTFYEGATVYAAFKPEQIKAPFDLTTALIEAGQKVIVKVNDTDTIEFN